MPRDGSGNYTLPPGNPVVGGTAIQSAWANPTMSDVATQLNNVLTRDNVLGPTLPFKNVNGSTALPGVTFASNTGTGLWNFPAFGSAGWSFNGTQVWRAYSGIFESMLRFQAPNYGGSLAWTPVPTNIAGLVGPTVCGNAIYSFIGGAFSSAVMVTIQGSFTVEPGGGPTGGFTVDLTMPRSLGIVPSFTDGNGAVCGSGALIGVSGGAVYQVASVVAVGSGIAGKVRLFCADLLPNGGGKKYTFNYVISFYTA